MSTVAAAANRAAAADRPIRLIVVDDAAVACRLRSAVLPLGQIAATVNRLAAGDGS